MNLCNDVSKLISLKYLIKLNSLSDKLGVKVYLVGGGIRDHILGRKLKDLDFVLTGNPEELPRKFAGLVGASFFWLDRERGQSRVIGPGNGEPVTFDFAPLRGSCIEDDLCLRDFTINAMALELGGNGLVIDPLQGNADLERMVIKACSVTAMSDDPIRLLRSVRLAVTLGFTIENCADIKGQAHLLESAAGERIRDEFLQILSVPGIAKSLEMLLAAGLLQKIVPCSIEGNIGNSSFTNSVSTTDCLDKAINTYLLVYHEVLAAHIAREVEGGVTARSLLMLAGCFGDGEFRDQATAWSDCLKLGKKASRMLAILGRDVSPYFAMMKNRSTPRMKFRFFRDHDPAGVELLLLACARGEAACQLCRDMLNYFFFEYDSSKSDLFLSGEEVMTLLETGEGKSVGEGLERLRKAEASGLVNNREEARRFVRNLLTKETSMS